MGPHSGYEGIAELEFERKWKTLPKSEFKKDTMATEIITAAEEQPRARWKGVTSSFPPRAFPRRQRADDLHDRSMELRLA